MFTPANAVYFSLLTPSVRTPLKVLAFEGTEAISRLYAIQVELVSEPPDFALESLLSQPARFAKPVKMAFVCPKE